MSETENTGTQAASAGLPVKGRQSGMMLRFSLALLTVIVVSCSGEPDTMFVIDSDGWTASPAVTESQQFRYSVINNDSQPHQPVLVKTDIPPDELPVLPAGYVDVSGMLMFFPIGVHFGEFDAGSDIEELFTTIEPGDSITDSVGFGDDPDLALGTYVFFCFAPGHYEAGEHTTFEVVA